MSSLTERLTELISPGPSGSDIKATNTPESWRPRLEIDPEKGEGYFISTPRPAGNSPDGIELLKEFDLDPNDWTITSIRKSRWQNHKGDWLEAFRASLVPTSTKQSSELDFDLEKFDKKT